MKVEYYREYSYILGRDMEFKVFGHVGKPCIAFPTQNGRFYDYENEGIIRAMSWYIEQGKIQVFCVDSIDELTWSNLNASPRYRLELQEAYFNYIVQELVPVVQRLNGANRLMCFGCSMGAYHAANFFLRCPDIFDAILALSGIYHSGYFIKDYADDLSFLNSPIDSLRQMNQHHPFLDLYRQARIIICVGQGAWEENCLQDTRAMDEEFKRHNIPAWIDYWGYDQPHDWSSWLEQTPYFLYHMLD